MDSQHSTIKKVLGSKLFLFFIIIILISVASNFINSWRKNREIDQEITSLEQNIINLEKDNLKLSELIKYLNSAAYIEEKARTDLGLKKEGEKTIIIPKLPAATSPELVDQTTEQRPQQVSNFLKWWQHLFNSIPK